MLEFLGLTVWEWLLPLAIGVVAGLGTNAVAVWMLFHPYQPFYLGRVQLFPQGAIPKEIHRIARRVGETVGRELLTPGDIARRLGSEGFRERFDETLRDALGGLLNRELASLRQLMAPEQLAGLELVLERLLAKLLEGVEIYLDSPELESRLRDFAHSLGTDLRHRPLSEVLTPELRADLLRAAAEVWAGVRESPELVHSVDEAVRAPLERLLVSDKPLRSYLSAGAVEVGESLVSRYLPTLLERLSGVLAEPASREKIQLVLRRMVDRFLDEQRGWKRLVGKLVATERTLERTVQLVEEGGVEELSTLLSEPEVQARIATAVNEGFEELLDRPVGSLFGDLSSGQRGRIREAVSERVVYMIRHRGAEEIVLSRLDGVLRAAERRRVGDLLDLVGEERGREMTGRLGDWAVSAVRGPRFRALVERATAHQTSWMLSVPIGRVGDYLPPDAERRIERLLFDPLWSFIQRRVPAALVDLPVARMVEEKLAGYPLRRVEELILRVSRKELVLIVYLGGFLGALIGGLMLFIESWRAGALATGVFLLLSFLFVNLRATGDT